MVLFVLTPMYFAGKIAKKCGRDDRLWMLLAIPFGWMAVAVIAIKAEKEAKR